MSQKSEKFKNDPQSGWPKHFLWGAASSAHQVEGHTVDNDWWQWEQEVGARGRAQANLATDHYRRYGEDFQLAKKLGHTAHRLSIEWSRIEPKPGSFNLDAVKHYRRVLTTLASCGMTAFVTLQHFTLPAWLAARGGFEAKESAYYFTRYARYCAEEFGDLVDFWLTLNEPVIYGWMGWVNGVWPPEKKNMLLFLRVMRHMARAHEQAYAALHAILDTGGHTAQVGVAHNPVSWYLERPHALLDNVFAQVYDWLRNHRIYGMTRGTHDFLGINYYFHERIKKVSLWRGAVFADPKERLRETSDLGWEVYPAGLYDVLTDLSRYRLPMYITENGIATRNDAQREDFIRRSLREVRHALDAGLDVRGYLYWSLTDAYEWEHGFSPRFGLIGIDYDKGLARTVRRSAKAYADIMQPQT